MNKLQRQVLLCSGCLILSFLQLKVLFSLYDDVLIHVSWNLLWYCGLNSVKWVCLNYGPLSFNFHFLRMFQLVFCPDGTDIFFL